MAVKDDGLYVTITTTPEGNALLEANPKLGVSARIARGLRQVRRQLLPGPRCNTF